MGRGRPPGSKNKSKEIEIISQTNIEEIQENLIKTNNSYDSSSIKHFKGLEGVQKRPTVYIGAIGTNGVTHLLREVITNSVDEYLNGHCSEVQIYIDKNTNSFTVTDNGRGIPFDKNALEIIMLNTHSGGKLDKNSYAFSAGLNGLGLCCITALCEEVCVTSVKEKVKGYQWFGFGKKTSEITTEKTSEPNGTQIYFKVSTKYLGEFEIDTKSISDELETLAYVCPKLKITLTINNGKEETFTFNKKNGLKDYIAEKVKNPIINPIIIPLFQSEDSPKISFEACLNWDKTDSDENIIGLTNSLINPNAGSHCLGFKLGLTTTIMDCIKTTFPKLLQNGKGTVEIKGDDVRESLNAIISVRHEMPTFAGQTKDALNCNKTMGLAKSTTSKAIKEWFNKNSKEAEILSKFIIAAAKGRTAAQKAKENVKKVSSDFTTFSNFGKLADAVSKNREECELFIIEG